MRRLSLLLNIICLLLPALPAWAGHLPMPSLQLRIEAQTAFKAGDRHEALKLLSHARDISMAHVSLYVQSNELRYIAAVAAQYKEADAAEYYFARAMDIANTIELWNHRLYASIGVLELQSSLGNKSGAKENALKAIDAGLLESVAATGEAAETGRFFTALDGSLTETERDAIAERIQSIESDGFRKKALHALFSINLLPTVKLHPCPRRTELSRAPVMLCDEVDS